MSMCPRGAKKERKPQKHAYVCPWGTKKEKKEEKRRKNPQKHAYVCPEGAKKMVGGQKCMVGAENTCWGLKTRAVG
jgi:hypothetical protein